MSDEEAVLVEPTSCAIHGMDRLEAKAGIEALVLGAGPSGLVFAQLVKLNGAARVVIAANKGTKIQVARSLDAADQYVELDRANPQPQWDQLKNDNPYGFDVVVCCMYREAYCNSEPGLFTHSFARRSKSPGQPLWQIWQLTTFEETARSSCTACTTPRVS